MPIGRLAARRALQRNEPNESEVPYVRLETPNRKVSRGQVCHDSGSQHGRAEVVAERSSLTFLGYEFRKVRDGLFGTGKRYLHFGPSPKSVKRVCQEVHKHTHSRNVLLPVGLVVKRVNKVLKGWGAFYSVGYPSRVFRKVNHYVLRRMARFLNRKSQRYYRLKFANSYYGELAHYGLHRLAWADVRRAR